MSNQLQEQLIEIFTQTLKQATFEAQQLYKLSKEDELDWDKFNGLDLGQHLQNIYAAFTTGDPKDHSCTDEIFKK